MSFGVTSAQQPDCGFVNAISYPINPLSFQLAQDYAVASPRHQGRFHTGEDWYGGDGVTVGQPIRAAARGRVTYSFARGWGRDGGVVIVEHTFSDGSVFYTQYGHMIETGMYSFPLRLSCVEQGDIIGAIGDVRPAPHLHFEVRVSNPDTPGAGYTRNAPFDEGYRDPGKFIRNQQLWLNLAHRWHVTIGVENPVDEAGIAPPFVLTDNSLLYLDGAGTTLRRATNDGRVLWRTRLESPAVAIEGFQGQPLLTYANGTMQQVSVENGALGDSWNVMAQFTGAPIAVGDTRIIPASNDTLVAIAANHRDVLWRAENIPPLANHHVLPDGSLALLTEDNELIRLSANGDVIDRTQLMARADFATADDGTLLVFSLGGLWRVDARWSLLVDNTPRGGDSGAILAHDERLYIFDGQTMAAYASDGTKQWETNITAMDGIVSFNRYEDIFVLLSSTGEMRVLNTSGAFCNNLQMYGTPNSKQWQSLGSDGMLRIALADQIIGLDWQALTRPCRI